ncbi:MAG: phosphotransferase [Oligoflexia bacterium]|nr:phosphotransferase [Oligoflexia bacterium]
MKPEVTEKLFVESLFQRSIDEGRINSKDIKLVDRLTGDASTRRYYRVDTENDSYVVCLDHAIKNPDLKKNEFIEVQKVFEANNISVPKIYDKRLEKGYILEEDLGDVTFLKRLASASHKDEQFKLYKQVIDELIKIHQIDPKDHLDQTFSKLSFDYSKLMYEVNFCLEWFAEKLIGIDKTDMRIINLRKEYEVVCEKIAKQHKVVTHRDFHSRNIMVKNQKLIIIDFQDARMGLPQYDLVSLLEDCYYELDRENVYKLKKYYWENFLEAKNIQKDFDEFESLYTLMTLQRTLKAIGSFAYIYNTRNDERYLKYIGFAVEKIKRFAIKDKSFEKLLSNLLSLYYEY